MEVFPLVTYWLAGGEAKNSITEKIATREFGPFCCMIAGCAFREISDEEVIEYVKKTHRGESPVRIERKPR